MEDQEKVLNEHLCKNCGNKFQGLYCNECGQKVIEGRNSLKHFFSLILDSFDIERGIIYTAKMLMINPGKLINEYLDGRTKDYYNPLSYMLIIAGLSALFMIWTNAFDITTGNTNEMLGLDTQTKFQLKVNNYIKAYLNFIPFLTLPFFSLISKWVFKKFKLFYAEHLIINCYLFSQTSLITLLVLIIAYFIPSLIVFYQLFGLLIFLIYFTYALKGVYKISWLRSFFSSIAIYLIGMLFFMIFILVSTIIIMIILKLSGFNLKELLQ